jgi:trigger factor
MAAAYNQSVDVVKGIYEKSGDQMSHFKHALLEKKAIKLIMEKNDIESVEPEKEPAEASE